MPRATATAVVLEILRQADGEWVGKAKLGKVFYFAHLYYGAERPGLLTDWPIARLPNGPGIHKGEDLFAELLAGALLTQEITHEEGPYPEYRYHLTEKGRQATGLPEDVRHAIGKAVMFCKDKTASELSQITHEHSRSWNAAKDGDVLNIDIDLIPEDEYAKRQQEFRRLDQSLADIFPEASA
jgi:hypothetical protein